MQYAEAFFMASDRERVTSAFPSTPSEAMPSCRVVPDRSDPKRWRTKLKLVWHENASPSMAIFTGLLSARPALVNSKLTLEGSYEWQFVAPNASPNPMALAIARSAARSVLATIVAHCEAEWLTYASECLSIATCNEYSSAAAYYARHVAS